MIAHQEKGNVDEVGNYHPICTLPALYKMFSTINIRLLEQKCREWCIKMLVATLDFMKAFDSRSHQSLWEALNKCGIESNCINFLRRLYAEQKGTVSTDKESDMFEIKRGTKQGDPLSSLLFNTVLQVAMKDDVERWQKAKGMGIRLGDHEIYCLRNLRFADDVLLFSTSPVQLQKCCATSSRVLRVGSNIHPDKTIILSNQRSNKRKEVEINNIKSRDIICK